jgi:hypothetical protein
MVERDRFELDLADALRTYAEEASTQVRPTELARHFAATYPRTRTFGPWRLGLAARLTWVLLLLVGLLAAMVGGLLIGGSQGEQKLTAVVPPIGKLFTCPPGTNPDKPGPIDQVRPPFWTSPEMAFDRRAGRLVALIGAAESPAERPIETWTFDVCTNTWIEMHPDREPPAQVGRRLVYDADSDLTIGVHYKDWLSFPAIGNVWAYDLEADTWTEHGEAPTDALEFYDPEDDLVVASTFESTDLWDYDVETDTWTPIQQANVPDQSMFMFAYDASVDRVVTTTGGDVPETWLFDIRTGAWSKSGAETPVVKMGMWAVPAVVYDEAAKRTVVAGDYRWAAYDATADSWEVLFDGDPGEVLPKPMMYDPVNQRLIVWGGDGRTGPLGDLVAFDLVTREWTVLLEAS